ncbi:MAG: aldehyde dehydrogenase family protein, partial [Phototrophicaceae bacterium]
MTKRLQNYIGGEWVESAASATIPVIDPATCETLAECPDSTAADVDRAVKAAREGFAEWRATPVMVRAQYMHHFK